MAWWTSNPPDTFMHSHAVHIHNVPLHGVEEDVQINNFSQLYNPYAVSNPDVLDPEMRALRKRAINDYIMMKTTDELPNGYTWYKHQIAGHNSSVTNAEQSMCQIGIIKKDSNHILKIVVPFERGECEYWLYKALQFVEKMVSDERSDEMSSNALFWTLVDLVPYVPRYCGVELVKLQFIVLEDLLAKYEDPCVMDIKMGRVSADPHAPPEKQASEAAKSPFQKECGFRILGYRLVNHGKITTKDRKWGYALTRDTIDQAFSEFFAYDRDNQCLLSLIGRITKIKKFFDEQCHLQFYASSLLLIYEGRDTAAPATDLRLIDFSHVFCEPGKPDDNYKPGIQYLLSALTKLSNRPKQN